MKKQFLTMMLMLVGMSAWAQELDLESGELIFESAWTDPGNEYQQKTVVYLRLNCDDETLYGSGNYTYVPEVAAFINGELRAVTSEILEGGNGIKLYALEVGGTDADVNEEIKFKIFHEKQGIIYPLTIEGGSTITYKGDHTAVYPSEYYTMSFTPAERFCAVKDNVVYQDDRNPFEVSIRIGAAPYILDNLYDEVKVYDASNNEMTKGVDYEAEPFWSLQGRNWEYKDVLGPANHQGFDHVKVDGKDAVEGVQVFDMSWGGNLRLGRLTGVNLKIEVLERYYPVESIEITGDAYPIYWLSTKELTFDSSELGTLNIYYNNNETEPTFPGVKFLSSSNTDVIKVVDGETLQVVGKGTATITVVDIDDENGKDVTATFDLNVVTALEGIQQNSHEISYDKTTVGEEDITEYISGKLGMSFQWAGGASYTDESYTIIIESDGEVIRFENEGAGNEDAESWKAYVLKKGTVKVTYVSNYDTDFQISYDLIVTQAPTAVSIASVDGKPVTEHIIVAVGEELTATAVVTPADADLSEFTFQIVDEYDQPYIDIVEQEMNQQTNECTLTFKFTEPTTDGSKLYLMAVAKGTMVEGELVEKVAKMEIQATQGVTRIEVTINDSEDLNGKSYTQWYDGSSCDGYINIKVYPENATDKSVTVVGIDGMLESDESYRYSVSTKGTYTVTIISNENSNATATFDLVAKVKVSGISATGFGPTDGQLYNDGKAAEVTVEYSPADADFDIEKLSYEVYVDIDGANSFDEIAEGWKFFDVERTGLENSIVSYQFTPRSLCYRGDVTFTYDTSEQEGDEIAAPLTADTQEFSIGEKISLNEGWNWVSFISAKNYDVNDLYNAMYDQEEKVDGRSFLTEVRSQNSLVIVDPEWGLFGKLKTLHNTESYKINIKADQEFSLVGEGINPDGTIESKVIAHGWNWISFPYEYAYSVEEILGTSNFLDEDVLLSKDGGFATFTGGEWIGSLTTLEPNQGYLLYSNVGDYEEFPLQMPNRYELAQGTFEAAPSNARDMNRSVWNYDGSRFANVMPIIGELIVPAGADVADYTIGAFVGDECRGEGRIVKGRAFITVAGESGEEVSFRAYNEWTGEYCEIESVVTFGSMLGSLKAPIQLVTRDETTSVEQMAVSLTVQGDIILAPSAIQVYDAQGKVVAEGFQRVDLSHLGQGVYVVKAGDENLKIAK